MSTAWLAQLGPRTGYAAGVPGPLVQKATPPQAHATVTAASAEASRERAQ